MLYWLNWVVLNIVQPKDILKDILYLGSPLTKWPSIKGPTRNPARGIIRHGTLGSSSNRYFLVLIEIFNFIFHFHCESSQNQVKSSKENNYQSVYFYFVYFITTAVLFLLVIPKTQYFQRIIKIYRRHESFHTTNLGNQNCLKI